MKRNKYFKKWYSLYSPIKLTSGTRQPSPEAVPEPEQQETKVAPEINFWHSQPVPEPEQQETNLVREIDSWHPQPVPEPEQQETNLVREIDSWHPQPVPEPELQETKVAPDARQPTPEVVSDPDRREMPENSGLSHANTFAPLYKYRLLIGAGIASVLVIIFAGYTTHRQSYLQTQKALEQIEALRRSEKYNECVQQAQTFPENHSDLYTEVQSHLEQCRQGQAQGQLAEAKELAEQRRFKDAIALAAKVPADTDSYSSAQQLMTQWSENIFQIASNKYQQGNLKEAVAIADAVPADSPLNAKIQAAIGRWSEEWNKDETNLQAAQKALDERHWQDAINAVKKVSQTEYWQKQTEPIIQKAEAEIASTQAVATKKTYQPRSRRVSSRRSRTASYRRRRSRTASYRRRRSRTASSSSKPAPSLSKPAPSSSKPAPPSSRPAPTISRSAPPISRPAPTSSRSAPPYRKFDTLR